MAKKKTEDQLHKEILELREYQREVLSRFPKYERIILRAAYYGDEVPRYLRQSFKFAIEYYRMVASLERNKSWLEMNEKANRSIGITTKGKTIREMIK